MKRGVFEPLARGRELFRALKSDGRDLRGCGEEACLRVMSPWRLLVSPAEDCLGCSLK